MGETIQHPDNAERSEHQALHQKRSNRSGALGWTGEKEHGDEDLEEKRRYNATLARAAAPNPAHTISLESELELEDISYWTRLSDCLKREEEETKLP
jgi:hypothetical protein